MTPIPWYFDLFILFLPLIFSTSVGLWINIMLRRINRQEGGKPWSIKKNFLMALWISSPLAALIQLLLQYQLKSFVYIENGLSMIVFDAVMSPFLVLILHNILLWYCDKNNLDNAYRFIRVKHTESAEFYAADVSDFTIQNYKTDNNDIREE